MAIGKGLTSAGPDRVASLPLVRGTFGEGARDAPFPDAWTGAATPRPPRSSCGGYGEPTARAAGWEPGGAGWSSPGNPSSARAYPGEHALTLRARTRAGRHSLLAFLVERDLVRGPRRDVRTGGRGTRRHRGPPSRLYDAVRPSASTTTVPSDGLRRALPVLYAWRGPVTGRGDCGAACAAYRLPPDDAGPSQAAPRPGELWSSLSDARRRAGVLRPVSPLAETFRSG